MSTWQVILILVGVAVLGLVIMAVDYYRTLKRRNFGVEYYNKFMELAEFFARDSFNNEAYSWLTYNAIKMQRQLGSLGVGSYRPPFSTYIVQGYQPLLNTIPQIRSGNADVQDLLMVDDMLKRYVGVMDEALTDRKKEIVNPLIWLREGIQGIMLLPFLILNWFGLLGSSAVNTVSSNTVFKLIAFLVALIGLAGSIVTIVLGWEHFVSILQQFR